MNRRNQLGTALIILAVVLFIAPVLFPVQPVLMHDTRPGTFDSQDQLEADGIEVVRYENLSEQGQEMYIQALENNGQYTVPRATVRPTSSTFATANALNFGKRIRTGGRA